MQHSEDEYQDLKRERETYRMMLAKHARPGCIACDGAGVITIDWRTIMCPCVNGRAVLANVTLAREHAIGLRSFANGIAAERMAA